MTLLVPAPVRAPSTVAHEVDPGTEWMMVQSRIGVPPVEAGVVQEMTAAPDRVVATTDRGADARPHGVPYTDGEAGPVPARWSRRRGSNSEPGLQTGHVERRPGDDRRHPGGRTGHGAGDRVTEDRAPSVLSGRCHETVSRPTPNALTRTLCGTVGRA